jgi:UDP-glucose 4-epimerase
MIGSHIADLLVKQFNPEIVILDNFVKGRRENLRWALTHGRLEIVEGDIRDAALVHEVVNGIDVVFHAAAMGFEECAEDPRLAIDVLVNGTFNLLEAAALNRVNKIIAASSASVYGVTDTFPIREDHHGYNNRTLHGAAKAFTESLLRSFHNLYGLNYVALRYFHVYGPRMDTHGSCTDIVVRWMDRLAHRQPCTIFGDGTETMDLVYVEDIARANILAATGDVTDQVFNIATGVETTLSELALTLGRVMGSNLQPEHNPTRKARPAPGCVGDPEKAERLLGFRPETSLEEGLHRLVSWWERQRALEAAIA